MINKQLVDPKSIVVVGGSNDIKKPGGKVLKNLIDGNYQGNLYVVNLKEKEVQGIRSYQEPAGLPDVEMAIIAIAARFTFDWVKFLTEEKNTKAFIILSAGFSELNEEGRKIEKQIVEQVNKYDAALIGPNCIGMLTPAFHGVFTQPIPKLDITAAIFYQDPEQRLVISWNQEFIKDYHFPKSFPLEIQLKWASRK